MMRLLRPLLWLAGGVGAFIGFVAVGRLVDVPVRWGDLSGWLDAVTIEEALVELARWLGMVLAGYVVVVAVLVLLGEVASGVRAVPLARVLRRLAGGIAVPALRRRLVEASTATAITVSAMSATASGGGVLAAAAPVEQTVDVVTPDPGAAVLPAGISPADVVGFGYDPSASPVADPAAGSAETRVTVERGDTMWSIAEARYGFCDASLIEMIRAASGIEDPNLIFAGQVLVLPALPSPPPAPIVAAEDATWAVHTVVYGDTFWGILTARYGSEPSTDLMWAAAEYNQLEDPSDIPVGTQLTLPPLAVLLGEQAAPAPPVVPVPAAVPVAVEAALPVVEDGSSVAAEPVVAAEAPLSTAAVPEPRVEAGVPVAAESVATPLPAPADRPPDVPMSTTSEVVPADEGAPVPPWLAAMAGATTLSVGLLAVYRRLRRRQGAAGARAWRLMPSGESARLHSQLVAAADLPLVRWASQELSSVMFGLDAPAGGPLAVELSDLAGVEVLWDAPMPEAPAPWEATSGGWSWRLLYDPLAEVPADELPLAVPGLVTLGRRSEASVLVDLEAYGCLSLRGDARAAEDVMRAIVLELGSGEELSNAWVSTVGLGVDGIEHLARVVVRDDADALHHAQGIVADLRGAMDDAGVDDTFRLRTSGPPAWREVTVMAVRAETCGVLDELLALASPRSGLAVVVLGDVDSAGLRATVDAAGEMELNPLALSLTSIAVSHEAAANTAVLLDAAAEHLTVEDLDADEELSTKPTPESPLVSSTVADEVTELTGPDGVDLVAAGELLGDGDDEDEEASEEPALLVRVLGPPRLEPPPEKFSRPGRVFTVFMACVGGRSSVSAARDATWSGARRSDQTWANLLGLVRSQLGVDVCPVRPPGPGTDDVYLVNTVTDLQLLEDKVAQAHLSPSSEALALLMEGLALVEGVPFDDLGYEWAIDRQLTARAAVAIETAALQAVELALGCDDVAAARSAVSGALKGLPGNELLYRARMQIEAHAGNRAGVHAVYEELVAALEELSGDSLDAPDPSPATRQLFEQLVDTPRRM